MIFNKKEPPLEPFTVEQCKECKKEVKRKFKDGDYLFKDSSTCQKCNGSMQIEKIFGQPIEQQ